MKPQEAGFPAPPGKKLVRKTQEWLSSGTFQPTQGLIDAGGIVDLDLRGSGGGGRSSIDTTAGSGGGSSRWQGTVRVTSLTAITVTIAASAATDTAGSNSTFGSLATAVGGGIASTTIAPGVQGGAAGSQGFPGYGPGIWNVNNSAGGNGGGIGGGRGGDKTSVGEAATANSGGGGGGGGIYNTVIQAGGASGSGYCLATWWEYE